MSIDDDPSVAEIAALTARLRELSNAGAAADPMERATFVADRDALIARVAAASQADEGTAGSGDDWADYRTYTSSEAAAELVVRGVAPDQADVTVEGYLDGLSWERGWSPQDQWEIDDDDIAVMLDPQKAITERGLTAGEGQPLDAGPALTAEEAAHELAADGRSLDEAHGLVRRYLDEVSERVGAPVHQWGLDGADLADIRAGLARVCTPSDEQTRRDQLNRWHADDHADEAIAADAHTRERPP